MGKRSEALLHADSVQFGSVEAEALLRQAEAHRRRRQFDLAAKALERLDQLIPGDAWVTCFQAQLEFERGRLVAAEQYALQALELDPGAPSAAVLLARCLCSRGQREEAIECLSDALRVNDIAPELHLEIGRTWRMLGQLEKFAEHLRTASDLAQADSALAHEAAMAFKALGEIDVTEYLLRRALAAAPRSAAGHISLGVFYLEQQAFDLAISALNQAIELDPMNHDAWLNLANAFRFRGELKQALECLDTLQLIRPRSLDAVATAGLTLRHAGRFDEAEKKLRQVLLRDSEHPIACPALAELLESTGRVQEALGCMQRLMAVSDPLPAHRVAYARLLRRLGKSEEGIRLLRPVLRDVNLSSVNPGLCKQVNFTLAKLYEDHGDFDLAWRHCSEANDAHWQLFDTHAFEQLVDATIDSYSAHGMKSLPAAGTIDQRPIFIVGMPRSGSTVVEQIISAHPAVHALGETGSIRLLAGDAFPASSADLVSADLDAMVARFFELAGECGPARRLTEKTPHNFIYLGLIEKMFPNARVVHCMRDVLDTAVSCYFQDFESAEMGYTFDLEKLGQFYLQYERLMLHWSRVLSLPLMNIRYEELVSSQEEVTRKLLDFVGLEWHPACLEFHQARRNAHTATPGQVRQALHGRSVNRHRRYAAHLRPLIEVLLPPGR